VKDSLEIHNLRKTFDTKKEGVINGIDLSLKNGSITAIVGKSGCGKTTLARLIAGLEMPDTGSITMNGEVLVNTKMFVPPERRNVALVFQDYALFPHLSVEKNVSYGVAKNEHQAQYVTEALELVGMKKYQQRYPHQLSGGQQQRVALARAHAPKPRLLILDEPFSNLDVALKEQLRLEMFDILRKAEVTVIFVTHDTQDAMRMADEIAVMKKGKLVQMGKAEQLFNHPKNDYVATLFGGIVRLNPNDLSCFGFDAKEGTDYALRTHHFQVNASHTHQTEAAVLRSVFLGTHFSVSCRLPNEKIIQFNANSALKGTIKLGFHADALLQFDLKS